MDVLHAAIRVDDVEAMKAFYTEGLGLERSREFERNGVTNYFLAGESDTEIQFKYGEGVSAGPSPKEGFDHTAIAVDDIDDAVDRLVADYGGELKEEPTEFGDVRVAFVADPDGYVVELIEE
ncbi:VOC family protein [Saliphagus infecundisoli]|uniref:VOC family protein n=1 Tax=Saliphagus infecundisoli TaxID=1849069 RepID=A0ABD5QFU5_9EURY|nr:VOC family protein [Saliphagus infecundisoli]